MKIVNLFKKELKTKWSSRLLVGVLMCLVCSLFASNIILKQQYDLVKDESTGDFKGYKKLVNQPFTHIKTIGGTVSQIRIESGNEPTVLVKNSGQNWTIMSEKIFVKNDTLFVNLDKQGVNNEYEYNYPSRSPTIIIKAPNIQSIDADNSDISVGIWQQKSMTVNLVNLSFFETVSLIEDLDFCKISMSDFSKFTINNYSGKRKNRNSSTSRTSGSINIQTVEANLEGGCELHLGNANIKNLKLNAPQGSKIELSSETLNTLMKQ